MGELREPHSNSGNANNNNLNNSKNVKKQIDIAKVAAEIFGNSKQDTNSAGSSSKRGSRFSYNPMLRGDKGLIPDIELKRDNLSGKDGISTRSAPNIKK